MCGEKSSICGFFPILLGSPPRVRGKGKNAYRPERTTGITPACAGKSPFFPGVPGLRWDHPRVCGEKNIPQIHISRSTGSPPRVRGKVVESWNSCVFSGITPACAGKSRATAAQQRAGRDHPRVCGEKLIASKRETLCTGSPPRVRGKAFIAEIRTRAVRITPACAGKSKRIAPSSVLFGDHPRVCGEKAVSVTPIRESSGSPPRVRGKEWLLLAHVIVHRITPACAGKSIGFGCCLCYL